MPVMGVKISEDILVAFDPEIFAAYFHSNDFLIAHGRREAAAPVAQEELQALLRRSLYRCLITVYCSQTTRKTAIINSSRSIDALLVNMVQLPLFYRKRPMDRTSFLRVAH